MTPDKQPPYNLEAERSVLGCMLLDNECIDEVIAILAERDYFRAVHAEWHRWIVRVHESGSPVDGVTLADALIKAGRYEALGGDEGLREVVEAVPHSANWSYYAQIVRERSVARRLLEVGEMILRDCYAAQKPASDLLCDAEEAVFAVGEDRSGGVEGMETLVGEAMVAIDLRADQGSDGLATGFADLDALTGGFHGDDLVVVGARPSQGKTALAMAISLAAAEAGNRVLFFSLEMGRRALMGRILSTMAGVDSYKVLNHPWTLSRDERTRLNLAASRLEGLPLSIDFVAVQSVSRIRSAVRRLKRRMGLALVVIDYLSLIDEPAGRGESRQEVVARMSRGLKNLARSACVPVLLLSQLNREVERRVEKRPTLADIRESGQVEQDADVVLLLHRPEYYDPNDRPGLAELIVAKNRNGATGDVRLQFDRWCTRFRPYPGAVSAAVICDDTSF